MKKIIIASVLVFGTLLACQKPSELDEIVNSKPNSSRSSKDDDGGTETGFYYNATLFTTRNDNKNEAIAKLFDMFPGAEELYISNIQSKITLSFLTVSLPINANGNQRVFALNSVQAEPITILNGILSQFKVCSVSSNPQIQCISQTEMQTKISEAFISAGYNLSSVSVSTNGNIEVIIRRPDSTLASCVATIIQYFN
jgi:hypothetical protein